jgi:putative aldouronate transport system substrate-binding protein
VRPEDFFSRNQSGQVFCYTYNWGIPSDVNQPWRDAGTGGKFDDLTKPVFELVYPALTYQGETRLSLTDFSTGWSSCFIAKTCQNPGRAINYMEFLKSPQGDKLTQWGIEGKHYTLTEDGMIKRTEEFLNYPKDHLTGIGPWYFQGSDWGEGMVSASAVVNCTDQWQLHDETQKVANRLQHKKSAAQNKNPVMTFARVDSTDPEMAIQTKLADEWTKRTAEMTTADSEASVERIWTDLQTYLKDNGLSQLEAKFTQNYVKNLTRYQDAGYFTDIVTK